MPHGREASVSTGSQKLVGPVSRDVVFAARAVRQRGTASSPEWVAVLSEALTNVARHAHADRAGVTLETDGREVRLRVWDNGVGIPSDGRRSGLRNMAERAEQLGGTLELSSPQGGGTALVWRVPVS